VGKGQEGKVEGEGNRRVMEKGMGKGREGEALWEE
jgi:hypothetical protein